jgi:Na+-driven multidrug efflux pump
VNNILAYYIIDIPLGIYFTFYYSRHFSREHDTPEKWIDGLGHKGLFIGKIIGQVYNIVSLLLLLFYYCDWVSIAEQAKLDRAMKSDE